MFVSFDDSGSQRCVGTDALVRVCQFEDETSSWAWWDAIVEQGKQLLSETILVCLLSMIDDLLGHQSENELRFPPRYQMMSPVRPLMMINGKAVGIHFGIGFIQFMVFGSSPLENEFLRSNVELLEQTVPDVDGISNSEQTWVVERVNLVEGNKSGAFRSDGQLVEIGTQIVDTSDASYLFVLCVQDVEVAFSMSTNSIITNPICQDLLSLVLLNSEVVGLSFDEMRPDEMTVVVEDAGEVMLEDRCVYVRRVVTGTDIVGDSKSNEPQAQEEWSGDHWRIVLQEEAAPPSATKRIAARMSVDIFLSRNDIVHFYSYTRYKLGGDPMVD
ncbi:hypothetical protein KCU65_g315, partial [Aureobasidium melanogenum]